MVIMRARVGNMNGETGQRPDGTSHEGRVNRDDESFVPQWVEIEKSPTGFILVSIDQQGCSFIETWSASMEEAKLDAAEQFSVAIDAWVPASGEVI